MLKNRIGQFEINIARATELVGMGESVDRLTSGVLDATDMYRAALVQAVAALDTYMHGVLLDFSVEIICGARQGAMSGKLGLAMGAVGELVGAQSSTELHIVAVGHAAQRLARETFQKPDDIAQAFAAVGINRIWSRAFGPHAGKMTEALNLVVFRRNQIVHACDVDPADPNGLLPLTSGDALASAGVVMDVVRGVHAVL